jgi:hypothetical protein
MLKYERCAAHVTVFFYYDIAIQNTTQNVQQATADYSHSQSTYYFKLIYLYNIYVGVPARNTLTVGT